MIEIRFHGRGGQGAVIASKILAYAFFLEGKYSQAFPTFGAERRGAPVAAFVRVDENFINNRSPIISPDYVIVMSGKLAESVDVTSGIKENGIVIINSDKPADYYSFEEKCIVKCFDVNKIALKYNLGTQIMPIINAPILGVFAKVTDSLKLSSLEKAIPKFVPVKIEENIKALREAYEMSNGNNWYYN